VAGRAPSRPGIKTVARRRNAYRGVNVLMLWAAAMEKGYSCPLWLTYKQAAELGGQVRKGEKGSLVVYANTFTKTGTDDKDADVEIAIPFMKGYMVFNAEQIDGLPCHFYATVPPLNKAAAQQGHQPAGYRRGFFCQHQNHHSARRQPGLLQP
jgi:antirestriction protein ArdC